MMRCQAFPPLGFVWNGVSGNDLIELLKIRKEKAEFEKEERRKAKRMLKEEQRKAKRLLKKSRKHDQIEEKNIHDQQKSKKKKNRKSTKRLEAEQTELQLKELFENWAPPPITRYLPPEDEDLDWLLGTTRDSTRQTNDQTSTYTRTASNQLAWMADVRVMPYTMIV